MRTTAAYTTLPQADRVVLDLTDTLALSILKICQDRDSPPRDDVRAALGAWARSVCPANDYLNDVVPHTPEASYETT